MGSDAVIHIPSSIKIGSGIKKLIGRVSQTRRQHGHLISLLLVFQNRGSRLKTIVRKSITQLTKGILGITQFVIS
jgi:hypothetical protein